MHIKKKNFQLHSWSTIPFFMSCKDFKHMITKEKHKHHMQSKLLRHHIAYKAQQMITLSSIRSTHWHQLSCANTHPNPCTQLKLTFNYKPLIYKQREKINNSLIVLITSQHKVSFKKKFKSLITSSIQSSNLRSISTPRK